jgi:hypothetical protein
MAPFHIPDSVRKRHGGHSRTWGTECKEDAECKRDDRGGVKEDAERANHVLMPFETAPHSGH